MLRVGLTGGIGSGKSLIARSFSILGIPVFDADTRSKHLINKNSLLQQKIKAYFGTDIFNKKGKLKSKRLANVVFDNAEKLNYLNNLIHPIVWQDFVLWVSRQKTTPYILQESAILIETGYYKKLDAIILVTSPVELCRDRLLRQKKLTKKAILQRMRHQLSDEIKQKKADFTIINDESQLLIPQILSIHKKLIDKG